ncbi:hypothetical protein [Nocardioides speluncae]|uniref:hypothetical protein n=1 Tax=Nocardioides speluncae TaxID=2670337 RepID=UPI000D68FD23|nr:hypothetical protein [Nocardioides speluncae]
MHSEALPTCAWLGDWPGDWLGDAAVAIMCMPCRRSSGSFVPAADLVLAELSGNEGHHPVHWLAGWCRQPALRSRLRGQARHLVVLFDDLAVARSWMLPAVSPDLDALWPSILEATSRLFTGSVVPVRVMRFSDFLDRHAARSGFERLVATHTNGFLQALREPDGAFKRAMEHELARRRRFARETSQPADVAHLRQRAASQLANYAAQGTLLKQANVGAYVAWTDLEVELMAAADPAFADHVIDLRYARPPASDDRHLVEAIPDDYPELRETLALYLRDLPTTLGAIVPGLAADVTRALGKLLTPGLAAVGARELTALNHVLPGGAINRGLAAKLIGEALDPRVTGWRRETTIKKLWCQLASRYDDEVPARECQRHHQVVRDLVDRLPAGAGTALVLAGSLVDAPGGMWHPYLSDIDVMPLHHQPPNTATVEALAQAYAATRRPPWLYLNTGARAGVAGLTRDPSTTMFAVDQIHDLTAHEFGYLLGCAERTRFVGGDRAPYAAFLAKVHAEHHRRRSDHVQRTSKRTPSAAGR